jgi:site-specific DNA recombinase
VPAGLPASFGHVRHGTVPLIAAMNVISGPNPAGLTRRCTRHQQPEPAVPDVLLEDGERTLQPRAPRRPRLDADALGQAVLTALAAFYRDHQQLIADAVHHARQRHHDAHSDRAGELATVRTDLTQTDQAIDRYLSAFERGTLDEETVATRLAALRTKQKQLRRRQTELTAQIDDEPVMPPRATFRKIAGHIDTITEVGTDLQRKALVEALIHEVKILDPGRLQPVFKVPRPEPSEASHSR